MIKQSDVEARLSLFRFGLLVITVVAFAVGTAGQFLLSSLDGAPNAVNSVLVGLGFGVGVGVVMAIIYFIYAQVLKRTVGEGEGEES
jgi:hypothetical protein